MTSGTGGIALTLERFHRNEDKARMIAAETTCPYHSVPQIAEKKLRCRRC